MHKHKEKLGYAFFAALIVASVLILTWTPGSKPSATGRHTEGMSPFEKMRANSESKVPDDPIAKFANEVEAPKAGQVKRGNSSIKKNNEKTEARESCSQDQRLMGECEGQAPQEPIKASSKQAKSPDQPKPSTPSRPQGRTNKKPEKESDLDWLADVTSGDKEKRIEGVVRTLPKGNIKAGCRFIGVIQDAIRVNSGFTNTITVNIRRPWGDCKLPSKSLKLKGVASMYNLETGFTGKIDTCTVPTSNLASVACKATVESVTGSDVLEGDIYDEESWGIFFDALLATGSAPFLAKIAETAASASTYWAAESSAIAGNAIAKAVERITAKINKKFEGREIRVPANAVVIITFDADAVL